MKTSKLPDSVVVGLDETGQAVRIPVEESPLKDGLGYLDTKEMKIVINSEQPEAGKHLILLHEMIHATIENMRAQGLCKRIPAEAFVENLAGGLFGMLAASGLLSNVDPEEAILFMTGGDIPEVRS